MNPAPYFTGQVKDGKLHLDNRQNFDLYIKKWEGKEVLVTIERKIKLRTLKQNKYLWAVIYAIVADHTGFTPEEVHQTFRKKFLTYGKDYKGKKYLFQKSTTALNRVEFGEYVEKIRAFVGPELGLAIPNPNEIKL